MIAGRQVAPQEGTGPALELARMLSIQEQDSDLDSSLDRSFSHASLHGYATDLDLAHVVEIAWRIEQLRRSSKSAKEIQDQVADLATMATRLRIRSDVETELDNVLRTDRQRLRSEATRFATKQASGLEELSATIGVALSMSLNQGILLKEWPLVREDGGFVLDNPGRSPGFTREFVRLTGVEADQSPVDLDVLGDLVSSARGLGRGW